MYIFVSRLDSYPGLQAITYLFASWHHKHLKMKNRTSVYYSTLPSIKHVLFSVFTLNYLN